MVRLLGLVAIALFVLQAMAYGKAPFKVARSVHCVVWPFGECESVVASGYAALFDTTVAGYAIEAALAVAVPLLMVLFIVVSSHAPKLTRRRGEARSLTPVAWLYGLLLLAVLAFSATSLRPRTTTSTPGARPTTSAAAGKPLPPRRQRAAPKGTAPAPAATAAPAPSASGG